MSSCISRNLSDAPALPSYSSGTSSVPLLGDTIGANLDRTVARMGSAR